MEDDGKSLCFVTYVHVNSTGLRPGICGLASRLWMWVQFQSGWMSALAGGKRLIDNQGFACIELSGSSQGWLFLRTYHESSQSQVKKYTWLSAGFWVWRSPFIHGSAFCSFGYQQSARVGHRGSSFWGTVGTVVHDSTSQHLHHPPHRALSCQHLTSYHHQKGEYSVIRYFERPQSYNLYYSILLKSLYFITIFNPLLCLTYKLNSLISMYRYLSLSGILLSEVSGTPGGLGMYPPRIRGDYCTFELTFKAVILLFNTENLEMHVFEKMRCKLGCINSESSAVYLVWPWANELISPCLSFLLWKMG